MPDITPVMQQYLEIKKEYNDAVLFFRMGDFYEMFYEDAKLCARELGLTLTSREKQKKDPVPMAGIPYHAVNGYLSKMLKKGYKVAICEQTSLPGKMKGPVSREVIQVVTPGTAMAEEVLDASSNNFLVSLAFDINRRGRPACLPDNSACLPDNSACLPDNSACLPDNSACLPDNSTYLPCISGIAMADLSTGEFLAGEISGEGWLDELERIGPNEILLSENEPQEVEHAIKSRLNGVMVTYREGWTFEKNYAADTIRDHFRVAGLKGFGIEDSGLAVSAAGGIMSYLIETQKASLGHITAVKRYRPEETMYLDARTRRNLELTSSLSEDSTNRGTLFGVIDETVTPMGSRLLKSWLTSPLLDPDEIARRHDGVQELVVNKTVTSELGEILSSIHDVERLISRVCLERANPRDILALADSLGCSWRLREAAGKLTPAATDVSDAKRDEPGATRIEPDIIRSTAEEIIDLREIASMISAAIVDEPPMLVSEGGIFRDGYSPELDELRDITRSGRRWIADLQEKERQRSGIANLKIKYNNVFGYFIEVSNSNLDRVPEDYTRKQTLVNAERFITPELKEYEAKVLSAGERIADLERDLFVELRRNTASHVKEIQAFSHAAAVLDVLHSFAVVAAAKKYVRPTVDRGSVIEIKDGRHPVVETILPAGKFVSNDTFIDGESDQILIITGPNMAGKSTYLRQVGLIVLLAQAGSFVPAQSAHIGVVDRIFTRVGASDNLAGGESTFLVEMNETANILNNCTPRSLILFDEVGRGTSTFDGLSIAWAIIEYLHQVKLSSARTLFATHFHELTELELVLDRVKNYNIAVKEWNDEVVYLRKIVEGGSDQSLGIQVARLAGLPPKVIARSREILANLEANELTMNNEPKLAASQSKGSDGSFQMSLFELPEHPVIQELREIDIDNLTPMRALLLLEQLKRKTNLEK